jgi:uridylate kinase
LRRSAKLVSLSLEDPAPLENGEVAVQTLRSAAERIQNLVEKGFRVLAIVGGGSLGEEYSNISRKYSKDQSGVKNMASEANALLLIAALREMDVLVNSAPILDPGKVDEFLSNPSVRVVVVANQEGRKRSSLVALELSRKHGAITMHYVGKKILGAKL